MAFIKLRKTERKNQMRYCELKDNKANTVALIHNVYILVLHSTVVSISLYYKKFLILWSSAFLPLLQRIRGEVVTSSLVYLKSGLSKFYLLAFTAIFIIAPGFWKSWRQSRESNVQPMRQKAFHQQHPIAGHRFSTAFEVAGNFSER